MWDDASNPVSNKVFYDKPQAPPSYAALLSGLVKEFVAWHDGESSIATFAKKWSAPFLQLTPQTVNLLAFSRCEALLDLRNEKPELAYDFDGLLAAFSAKQQKKHQKSNKKKPGAEKEENDDFAPTANVRPMLTKFSLEVASSVGLARTCFVTHAPPTWSRSFAFVLGML